MGRVGHLGNARCLCVPYRLFFIGVLCLALCFVLWVAHGVVVLCEELIRSPGKYCPVLLLKKDKRLMISSYHQRVEKYCKLYP